MEIVTEKETVTGIFMPSSGKNIIIIKLNNGYNIGLNKKDIKEIKVIERAKFFEKRSEELIRNKDLPTISILHTGGTIASKVDYRTGGVVSSFEPAELIDLFPELKSIANLESELISQMWSDDLRFKHCSLIAEAVEKQVKKGVKGIIVGMGTDNLAVASAALSFIIEQTPIPIIFVGSQRSSDRGSSDAGMNLICAAEFIIKTDFSGVAICMHETADDQNCIILPANKTYKLHSSRRDAFKSINAEAIARVNYQTKKIIFLTEGYSKPANELIVKPMMEEKVGLLKVHLNMFPEQFEFFAKERYKGLIIEGTGLGHTPGQSPNSETEIHKKIYPAIKKLINLGCVVVMTTQCLFGGVNMNVYDKGRELLELGVVSGKDMLANTALVKLSWLLANYKKEEIKKLIGRNLRGEINERIGYVKEFI